MGMQKTIGIDCFDMIYTGYIIIYIYYRYIINLNIRSYKLRSYVRSHGIVFFNDKNLHSDRFSTTKTCTPIVLQRQKLALWPNFCIFSLKTCTFTGVQTPLYTYSLLKIEAYITFCF